MTGPLVGLGVVGVGVGVGVVGVGVVCVGLVVGVGVVCGGLTVGVGVGLGVVGLGAGVVTAATGGGSGAGGSVGAAPGPGSEGTVATGGTSIVGIALSFPSELLRLRRARKVVRPPMTANAASPMTIIEGPAAARCGGGAG